MEDIVYERDYRVPPKPITPMPEHLRKIMQKIDEFYNSTPKEVDPKAKGKYDVLLERCDQYAREHHGKLVGRVDYTNYIAEIWLTLDEFDFYAEDIAFLMVMSVCANIAEFSITEEAEMLLHMVVLYFKDVYEPEAFKDMVVNDPDYLTLQEESKKKQETVEAYKKKLGLNDPDFLAIVREGLVEYEVKVPSAPPQAAEE